MASSQLLSDADDEKFVAEFGFAPESARQSLIFQLRLYRKSIMDASDEVIAKARTAVPFPREEGQSKREYLFSLAKHFKTTMFKWVSQPPCSTCGKVCKAGSRAHSEPTEEELAVGYVQRVEVWACGDPACGGTGRFPRYRDPLPILLHTRRGRCGEWVKAFWLLLKASGEFDVRVVYDFTDHVWVEVEMEDGKWVHCDVCELAVDNPLMYERDWGKQLTWIFAIDVDGTITDVTPKYTNNLDSVHERWRQKGVDPADEFWRDIPASESVPMQSA